MVALALVTAVLAAVVLGGREKLPERSLLVTFRGAERLVDLDSLTLRPVSGTVINGKGEEKEVSGQGLDLSQLLQAAGIDPAAVSAVTVTADDAFSARLSGEEVNEDGKAVLTDDGEELTLIVFGDTNSKRRVHNVVRIDAE